MWYDLHPLSYGLCSLHRYAWIWFCHWMAFGVWVIHEKRRRIGKPVCSISFGSRNAARINAHTRAHSLPSGIGLGYRQADRQTYKDDVKRYEKQTICERDECPTREYIQVHERQYVASRTDYNRVRHNLLFNRRTGPIWFRERKNKNLFAQSFPQSEHFSETFI